ncbi:MAG: hypothetical protein MAG451_00587 [Anaerolineales bacterium]|nr:hypothetical protein [Anaerolineales bacterium]
MSDAANLFVMNLTRSSFLKCQVTVHLKDVYGANYAADYPEAETLKNHIYRIFQCQDKRTARRRYAKVMGKRDEYVKAKLEAATISKRSNGKY